MVTGSTDGGVGNVCVCVCGGGGGGAGERGTLVVLFGEREV